MKLITDIWRAFLGGHSWAPSGEVDPNKVWGAVRDGLMVVLASCARHMHGFGIIPIIHCLFSGLSASWWLALVVGIASFIRRFRKDYSKAAKRAAKVAEEVSDGEVQST